MLDSKQILMSLGFSGLIRGGGLLVLLLFLGACNEDEVPRSLQENLDAQEAHLTALEANLKKEREKLVKLEARAVERSIVSRLQDRLADVDDEVDRLAFEITSAEDNREVSLLELVRLQRKQLTKIRREGKGQVVDLSPTMGPGYEEVRVFRVMPTGIRILRTAGGETVPVDQLPAEIKERFQLSEEEAQAYQDKLQELARQRAEQAREEKSPDPPVLSEDPEDQMHQLRIVELERQIESIERRLQVRLEKIAELQSAASSYELKSAEENDAPGRKRAIRRALKYRDEADEIAEGNSRALKVISKLEEEIKELEGLLKN